MADFANFFSTVTAVSAFVVLSGCQTDAGKSSSAISTNASSSKPNIVLIYADDLGFGDIRSYNPDSAVPTPYLNDLAAGGMSFTDAHSSSAVCTPSRYSLMTGRYSWRTRLKRAVLQGRSPLLIDTERETIASLLKRADYKTIIVGKWHLGIGDGETDYAGTLSPGPNAVGFDYYYGIPASLDMEPYVLVENESVITPLKGGTIKRSGNRRAGGPGFWRPGEIGEGFVHEDILPILGDKAASEILGASKEDKPFFLYFPLTSPHTPWLPIEDFRGVSTAGYYGDFVAYTDAIVGQVTDAIKQAGIEDNTLVILTSDNGAHWKPDDIAKYNHLANGLWRGMKTENYEGGHRVPFIVKWPGHVTPGSQSDDTIVQNDVMRTVAAIIGVTPETGSAPDSVDFSPVLLETGAAAAFQRGPIVHHSWAGKFAIRIGDWKLFETFDSGGIPKKSDPKPAAGQSSYQLYNLADDPAETINLADQEPERVAQMLKTLNEIRDNGN
ncbi:MAG: sulfatase family protein [Litorimonas sp.]